ncbi:MAG: hypothetical protein JJE13_10735 [Thermoleophilia bacterium]|nr:hypothetical protein [Thermoleophilia bacterium]
MSFSSVGPWKWPIVVAVLAAVALVGFAAAPAGASKPEELLQCSSLSQTITKSDGSIVGIGETNSNCAYRDGAAWPIRSIVLVQVKADGSVDENFADGGVHMEHSLEGEFPVRLLRADGGEVVLVTSRSVKRFDSDGQVVYPTYTTDGEQIRGAAIQRDGQIVVAMAKTYDTTKLIRLFGPYPEFDPTFGTGGVAEHQFSAQRMAIDRGGRIILAGGGEVLRLLPDGAVDLDFGPNGDGRASALPLQYGINSLADVTVDDADVVRLYGEVTDGMYGFYGFRAAIDADGNPLPGETGQVGDYLHTGHAFAEMSDGRLAYSVLPGRGEFDGEFSFGYTNREPLRLNLSPGGGVVLGISQGPDGNLLAAGSASGPSCAPVCREEDQMALVKWDPVAGAPVPGFGNNGVVLIPGNYCDEVAEDSVTAWKRCKMKAPELEAKFRFKRGASRRPAVEGTVDLGEPPEDPPFLREQATVRLPSRLRLRPGKLRSHLFIRSTSSRAETRLKSIKGRTITFSFTPNVDDWDGFYGDEPLNKEFLLQFGFSRGALKAIPRKLRRKPLGFRVTGSYVPALPYSADALSPWYAGSSSSVVAKAKPVKRAR